MGYWAWEEVVFVEVVGVSVLPDVPATGAVFVLADMAFWELGIEDLVSWVVSVSAVGVLVRQQLLILGLSHFR